MNITCPNCHSEGFFDDGFTHFVDCGDYVKAHATCICPECNYIMTVQTSFTWDESVEVY